MVRGVRRAALLALLALLTACAGLPLYQPASGPGTFGYSERAVGADLYEVSYRAPTRTTYAYNNADRESDRRIGLAYDLALLRAAELALNSGSPVFAVRRRDNDVAVDLRRGRSTFPSYYGGYRRYPYSRYDDEPLAVIRTQVTLLVGLFDAATPGPFDSAEMAARLRRQYADELPPGR